ncbi:MAG: TetR/AcrR family transcriptional regulator [Candidatus Cloacimonetes bacterium]|nr:TetR/AcrR family transcriptional regulator [Candidatus Cloacimonadota bacterium]
MLSKIKAINTTNMNPKQKKLLGTAFQLFLKHGFKRVSVEEICREATVSKVTFYRHYKSKEELISFIISSWVDKIMKDINTIMDSKQSIKDKFDKIATAKQEFSHNMGEEMLRSIILFPSAMQHMEELGKLIWQKLSNLLEQEQKMGNINPKLDVKKTVKFLISLNNLYQTDELLDIYGSTEEMIAEVNELLIMGLVARKEI